MLYQGDKFNLISTQDDFLVIKLPNGDTGFITKDSIIPASNFNKVTSTAAQDYIKTREQEHRIDVLMQKIDTQSYRGSFNLVIYDLLTKSKSIHKSLKKLQAEKKFHIKPDAAASARFSRSTRLAMQSNNYDQAVWEARAGIEADPMNPEHHMAFSLANYHLRNYKALKSAGMLIPKIAPTSTDAWMLFALGNSLTSGSNDLLTTSAFVLAIKLSQNPINTRQYYRELAEAASQPRVRELLTAALS